MSQVTKSGNGSFKFAGKTYKIKSSSETVTFNLDDAGAVISVEGLEGIIAADFSDSLIVDGDTVQVAGDKNNLVSVTASSAGGVSEIGGVNGDSVTIVSAGKANKISTTSNGTFIIADGTFNIKGDKNGVDFNLSASGKVTGVSGLDGTINADFSNGLSVNDSTIKISGDVSVVASSSKGITEIKTEDTAVTISGAGGSEKFTASNDGSFTFGKSTFEVIESGGAGFELDETGAVTGVTSLKGALAFTATGAELNINKTALTIGLNDAVTIYTDSKGAITGVAGLDTYIEGLPANSTVSATDKNVTVNGVAFSVDEGTNTAYNLALDKNGVPTQLSDLSSGVVVYSAPNMQLVTGGNGTFRIGGRAYTITGADSGSFFTTDENSSVTAIDELGGAIAFQGDTKLSVNGHSFAVDKLISSGSTVTIYSGSGGIYNIYGLESGDSVEGDLNGAAISMQGAATSAVLNINSNDFKLFGDADGVMIIPAADSTAVKYLSAKSSLVVNEGAYKVTNDDGDTSTFTFDGAGTVMVDDDGVIYTEDPQNFNLTADSDIDSIINTVALQPNNFINLDNPVTAYDPDISSDLNLVYNFDNTSFYSANYDFSSQTSRKRISLGSGEQNVTLSNAGDNIIVVKNSATGDKKIFLGNGGDNVVVDTNSANVTVYAGAGNDDIVSKSDISLETNNSGVSKFTPLNDAYISLLAYGDEEYNNGSGVQTTLGNIAKAVKAGSIIFGDGKASIRAAGTVVFNSAAQPFGYTKANFYDRTAYSDNGNTAPSKVAFTHSAGGTVNLADSSDNLIIAGNYFNDKSAGYSASLLGGKGNDTFYAGAGDSIDGGDGNNLIELSKDRTNATDAATIFITSTTSKDTVKSFNFGSSDTADRIQTGKFNIASVSVDTTDITLDLQHAGTLTLKDASGKTVLFENDYINTLTKFQFGGDRLIINDAAEFYWAGSSNASVAVGSYTADSLNIDITNSQYNDTENLRFRGDIQAIDAGNFSGASSLTGNDSANVIVASSGGSTIFGGKGNDTISGGDSADLFLFSAGHGKDLIRNFYFGTSEKADKINAGELTLKNVTADSIGNVGIELSDGNFSIEGAVAQIVQFENEYFGETVTLQLGYNELTLSNVADYYWAGGSDATLNFGGYSAASTNINLKSTDFADEENLHIYGDIQAINAGGYAGALNLTGNTKNNSITLGSGAVIYNYAAGDGNDSVYGFNANDSLIITGAAFSTVVSDNDIVVTVGKQTVLLKDSANYALYIDGTIEGSNANKNIIGTERDDTITNTVAGAVITALGNNDSIYNKGNRVSIEAGNGKDTIQNDGTNSTIMAGMGDDSINNSAASVTIIGGTGYDTISSKGKNSSLDAGDGNDFISNDGEKVTIFGGKGNDTISSKGNTVSIDGGLGNESILSNGQKVTITGNKGDDFISLSSASKDVVLNYNVGDDNDTIVGIKAGDILKITGAKFTTVKSGQNIKVNVDEDTILLRDAVGVKFKIDGISSDAGTNLLKGTERPDTLTNTKDLYTIQALGGADSITNSGSSVTIIGGTGNDKIVNSGSSNVYQYASGDGNDTIYGYTANDTLEITRGTIKSSLATGSDFILNIGAGSVTFKDITGDAVINIKDANGVLNKVTVGRLVQGTSKADTLANIKEGYQIEGYAGADKIYNSGSKVTIIGGTGNDTITNSGEKVLYKYATSDGIDVINGFSATDTLQITKGKISSTLYNGTDLTFNISAGKVILKDIAADSKINITNADNTKTVLTVPRLIQGTTRADILTNAKNGFTIEALAGADKITNSGSNVTITGGAGNDTIINSGDKNLYLYGNGEGNDVIQGFGANDTLQLTKGTVKSSLVSGSDFILNVGGGKVTFKNVKGGQNIKLINAYGVTSNIVVPKILQGTTKADTLNNSLTAYTIEGLAGNDKINNTASSVTIIGGKGNDTITTGGVSAKTVYQYASGDGNDVISGWNETDTIQITSGTVKSTLASESDLVIAVGSGSITVKDVSGKKINLREGNNTPVTFTVPYIHRLTKKSDTFTNEDAGYLVEALAGADSVENYAKNVTIDGGDGNDYLYNNGSTTSIFGAAGNDLIDNFASGVTIVGGKGNDTINNTGEKNIYQYGTGDGKDTINGFSANDTLQITQGFINSTSVKGMDVILNVSGGSITLSEVAGKTVNLLNSAGNLTSTVYSGIWEGTAKADSYENRTSNLHLKALGGNDTIKNYAANVSINGGAGHDSITLDSSKNITVIGGAGNDTITSSSKNGVLYQYASGEGKDVIVGYNKKDTLQITNGVVKSVTKSGGNTIITVGSGSITLQKYTGTVNLVDKKNAAISVSSKTFDLFEDDNYITGEMTLDTIVEEKYSVTQIQSSKVENIAQETTFLTFADEK